jgi:dynein heavy chain, axonemal
VPALTKKAVQLFETFNVRFGVMIVGLTNTGKTTCTELLARASTALRKQGNEDPLFRTIRKHVLNPKAISMGELYGEVNELTQEWSDGLASSIMRECVG